MTNCQLRLSPTERFHDLPARHGENRRPFNDARTSKGPDGSGSWGGGEYFPEEHLIKKGHLVLVILRDCSKTII